MEIEENETLLNCKIFQSANGYPQYFFFKKNYCKEENKLAGLPDVSIGSQTKITFFVHKFFGIITKHF